MQVTIASRDFSLLAKALVMQITSVVIVACILLVSLDGLDRKRFN